VKFGLKPHSLSPVSLDKEAEEVGRANLRSYMG